VVGAARGSEASVWVRMGDQPWTLALVSVEAKTEIMATVKAPDFTLLSIIS